MSDETTQADNTPELPKGFTCKCGTWHSFPMWVYAHWQDCLTFACPECSHPYDIYMGRAYSKLSLGSHTGE